MPNNQSLPNIDLNSSCVNYTNVKQGIITITEDKLNVILLKYENKNNQFYSWTTPLGIFISCLLATITSTFSNLGVSADTWKAIFIICTIISGIWLIIAIIDALKNRKGRKIEDLIETIKNNH